MAPLTPREPRTAVLLPAQLKTGAGWGAVTICDVSPRGLSLRTATPPPRGSFVELRHGPLAIVGQVRWSAGGRCGIHTRQRIALAALLGAGGLPRRDRPRGEVLPNPLGPTPRGPDAAAAAACSRIAGQAMEWLALVAIGTLAAGAIAMTVQPTLPRPLAQVRAGLAPRAR